MVAEFALEGQSYDAAASLAVSAAINAADALCISRLGFIPSGQDHEDAVRVLQKNGFGQVSTTLGRVLSIKHRDQYSANRVSAAEAEKAVQRADRLLTVIQDSLL